MNSIAPPQPRKSPLFSVPQLVLMNAALTVPSYFVVIYNAGEEPFITFDWTAFSICVLAGSVLLLAWIAWGAAFVASRRAARHPVLLSVLGLWAVICMFYVSIGVYGYVDDVAKFERMREQRGAAQGP